jgi:hypothetical protein
VLPEDFGLLTNLTSLELRENLIKVTISVNFVKNCWMSFYLQSVASGYRGCQKKICPKLKPTFEGHFSGLKPFWLKIDKNT